MTKMLPNHRKVLEVLAIYTRPHAEMCYGFKPIADYAEMQDVREVRRIVRHLARKGLAEYHKGLFTEYGELAGSGYCITPQGLEVVDSAVTDDLNREVADG